MWKSTGLRTIQYSFLLALFLHLLLLMSFTLVWVGYPVQRKLPSMYVPSYTYQEPPSPPSSLPSLSQSSPQPEKKLEKDKLGLEKANETVSMATQMRHASKPETRTSTKVTEAINLVGDKKTIPKPLIILLGKALTKHLIYPKIAVDFRIRGKAYVSFILHPDGTLTNIQLVESSEAGVLDEEAIAAVTAISPVKNVDRYVDKPKPMVVGIIFD